MSLVAGELRGERAGAAWQRDPLRATSLVTYAECRAAIAAATRARRLTRAQARAAKGNLDILWPRFETVWVTDELVRRAGNLADRRGLRGFDAIHLASALALGTQTIVLTWDMQLARAAKAEGLSPDPPVGRRRLGCEVR